MHRATLARIITIIGVFFIFGLSLNTAFRLFYPPTSKIPISKLDLDKFFPEELSLYDGSDSSLPIFLALNGYVYDVSAGRESYYDPGKPYHYLVGKDSSLLLNLVGGGIIKEKYPIIGILVSK